MNAVERIQAAIVRLKTLKGASTPGPWERGDYPLKSNSIFGETRDVQTTFVADTIQGTGMNAELIVTLHRMIDAQLSILCSVLAARDVERNWETLVYTTDALALADAVLGYDVVPSGDSLREAAIGELRKAGMSDEDILSGGVAAVLRLATVGCLSVPDAVGILGDVWKNYDLRGEDLPGVAAILATTQFSESEAS